MGAEILTGFSGRAGLENRREKLNKEGGLTSTLLDFWRTSASPVLPRQHLPTAAIFPQRQEKIAAKRPLFLT
jgi:hypothetical protein